ncbi:MAG TPA: L-rhamnose/proton symporter RhaT [Bryobacteraceae bacterium]|nr:L-rhamnose/proton symporter RhaT [Bryobacteraceae bacterium]
MDLQIFIGAALIVAAGALQGAFGVPMKFARGWEYENIWLVFALSGLVVFPWLLTFATVPQFVQVYAATSSKTLLAIAGFGVAWGAGATLTGLGMSMLGIGLGLAIILGLSASIGSLVPLLALNPEKIFTAQGHLYIVGTLVMLVGIGIAAVAGRMREQTSAQPEDPGRGVTVKASFLAGLLVCCASGILSSMLNFSYAFGTEAIANARHFGVSPVWLSNVVAAPAASGGFIANFLYCAYLLRKNRTTPRFWNPKLRINWLHGSLMGAFWFGGLAVYGIGVYRMGDFGTVAGWPLLMGTIIVVSNAAGWITGEWKGVERPAKIYLIAGMVVILVALWILALAQQP